MESVVQVAGYVLEPGNPAGTAIRREQAAAGTEAEALRDALDSPVPPTAEDKPALAAEVEEAAEATAKIERAVALCKGAGRP